MEIGEKIKKIREVKKLSQKEVITTIGLGAAMYSRIESGKTEPSLSTLEKISKALGVKLSEFFEFDENLTDINSVDKSLMEKLRLIEDLNDEEKKTVFSIVDAFVSKKKLKSALSTVLHEVN